MAYATTIEQPKKSIKRESKEWTIAFGISLLVVSFPALAQTSNELGDGICKVVGFLTGKWLFGLGILATLGAGAALLFGAELTDGVKKLATIITIIGLILSMSSILSFAFAKFSAMGQSCS